ncbi:hypothetical protein CGC21_27525 [Leishmania donovani]|uniref:Uncharacterized protein n=1 Tax=Leishmania donovani TaxID=5661 RepID=A0A504XZL7_LEIDO|nr:hypothetical protein CGC21_27525 [Leishmania donovani]
MPATLSADAALPSTEAPSVAEAHGYRSLHGDFNYYPTSAHKRRAPCEASSGAAAGTTNRVEEVALSPSTHCRAGRADTSPSPSGLSRSPSQGTLDIGSLARLSSSQPLASMPHEGNAALKSASVSRSFAKGGTPLLHRYRTSRADIAPLALHRSASLPLQTSTCNPVATGVTTKRLNNIRRSLLHTRSAAPSKPHAGPVSPKGDAVAREAVLHDSRVTPLRTQQLPPSTTSFSRKRADNADAEVPLTSVRLVDAAPASSSSLKKSAAAPVPPVAASRRATGTPGVNDVLVEGEICRKGEGQDVGTVPLCEQTHPASLLSRSVAAALYCHDKDCMHSEQSICEFIHMQRELRRCYATMENYEVVIAQLRDDCALSRAQLCRSQQEYAQHGKEMEAQVRAVLTEQTNALLSALRQSGASDASCLKTSAGPDRNTKDAAEECLRDTWQATLDELRRALREEQSAHAECLARLTEALAAKARWKSRAVELLKAIGACGAPPGVSTIGNCASDSQAEPNAGNSASDASSPSQRLYRPPSLYKPPPCVSSPSEAGKLRSSMTSEASTALPASPYEGATGDCASDKENEKDSSSMPGVDMNCQSDTTVASFLSPSATPAGRVAQALGSGVVVVWPPLAEGQEMSTEKSAESSRTQSSTTAAALESGDPALLDDAGKQGLQPSPTISSVSPGVLPSSVGRYTTSAVGSRTQDGCRLPLVGCEKAVVAAEPLRVMPDPFAFPRPPPSGGEACTIYSVLPTSDGLPTSCDVSAAMASGAAERQCKELLRALLDKEQQLALIAEERTKYKRLYEATRS